MQTMKSSKILKADAREQLLGKYKTVIMAFLLMQILLSGCLSIAQSQLNLQSLGSAVVYYAVYLILVLFGAIFTAGQNYLYLNIARGQEYGIRNIWYPFRSLADKCLLLQLFLFAMMLICSLPLLLAGTLLISTGNSYFVLPVVLALIFFLLACVLIKLDYSQVFYLVLDQPSLSVRELLKQSKTLMKGHKGGYFYLLVSFIGIFLLTVLTFGVGTLWAYPYFMSAKANYYLNLTSQTETTH